MRSFKKAFCLIGGKKTQRKVVFSGGNYFSPTYNLTQLELTQTKNVSLTEGGFVNGSVISTKYRPSPIPSIGLEIR